MNIFCDRFTTGQVVAVTCLPNNTLQSWLKRGVLTGMPSSPIGGGGVSGSHRRFSFCSVMEVAVAKALGDVGLSAANAVLAAKRFAHAGDVEPIRFPGLPFDDRGKLGNTMLCAAGGQSSVVFSTPGTDVLSKISARLGRGFVVLEINDLFDNVVAALGYHPTDVMATAYQRDSQ